LAPVQKSRRISDGPVLTWHRNGQKANFVFYDKNKTEGATIWWYENGIKKSEEYYNNDIRIYEMNWDENGNLISEGKFVNGKPFTGRFLIDGKVIEYKHGAKTATD
jgi:antitoxin component YwqK of YwqJK toxin-antitoxin module